MIRFISHSPRRFGPWGWAGAAVLAAGIWALWPAAKAGQPAAQPEAPVASLAGGRVIAVQPGSLLEKKLQIHSVARERISTPLLDVTGAVVARLRSGNDGVDERWQFSSMELSGIFADWEKASTEMDFAAKQLDKTRELTAAQINAQRLAVERLRKLVATGTEANRDLIAAEANLLQTQLGGQKAVYEAETALTQASHSRASLERQLLQAGVDPALLQQATAGTALVMADVPEVRIGLVAAGQSCVARFYGLPERSFPGKVSSLAPALSAERRTLRVFFELHDPDSLLKPGMYAEIGLGTDPREALLAPSDAVLHIGDTDYVLVQAGAGLWRVTPVAVGEQSGERVEILHGLDSGVRLIGNGAILLKPLVVQALADQRPPPAGAAAP